MGRNPSATVDGYQMATVGSRDHDDEDDDDGGDDDDDDGVYYYAYCSYMLLLLTYMLFMFLNNAITFLIAAIRRVYAL